jgi:chromosome segregation ATPase
MDELEKEYTTKKNALKRKQEQLLEKKKPNAKIKLEELESKLKQNTEEREQLKKEIENYRDIVEYDRCTICEEIQPLRKLLRCNKKTLFLQVSRV